MKTIYLVLNLNTKYTKVYTTWLKARIDCNSNRGDYIHKVRCNEQTYKQVEALEEIEDVEALERFRNAPILTMAD